MNLVEQSKGLLDGEIFHRTSYFKQIDRILQTQHIVFIQGKRRVGKSYVLMGYLQEREIPRNKIFFLTKELDLRNEISNVLYLDRVFCEYQEKYGDPEYIVLDEIQDVAEWERFVRAKFAEKKYKILLSGSNSEVINAELAKNLSGSYLSCTVRPLNYSEFVNYSHQKYGVRTLLDYIKRGGMPEKLNTREVF